MPFLDDIVTHLVAQGVGIASGAGKNIFKSSKDVIPVGAGPYLSVIETGGSGSSKTQNDTATENPTASLSCRAESYVVARTMLKSAYNALGGANGLYNVWLGDIFYVRISARQGLTDLGIDATGKRVMLVFNIDAERQNSDSLPSGWMETGWAE